MMAGARTSPGPHFAVANVLTGATTRRSAVTEQPTGRRARAARQAAPEAPWDASDGDLAEQRRPAEPEPLSELQAELRSGTAGPYNGEAGDPPAASALPVEANPADVIEQQLAVPAEPDEYR